jgi:hypothetical protein
MANECPVAELNAMILKFGISEQVLKELCVVKTHHVLLFSCIAMVSLLPGAANADCDGPPIFAGGGTFCNGCKYEASVTMARDQTCSRAFSPGARGLGASIANPVEFLGSRISQRARHGVAGVNGTTFAYNPGKGYSGTDDFTVEVAFRQGRESGNFTIHWVVTVR